MNGVLTKITTWPSFKKRWMRRICKLMIEVGRGMPKTKNSREGGNINMFVQFSSLQSLRRVWLRDSMNCSMPGLPVHHQLPEFTKTHIHWVADAIQASHPLSSPSPPAPNPSQHQSLPMSQFFAWGGQSTGVSALASFLPKKSQGWSPSEWTGWISSQSKGIYPPIKAHFSYYFLSPSVYYPGW